MSEVFGPDGSDFKNPLYQISFDTKTAAEVFGLGTDYKPIKIALSYFIAFILLLQFVSMVLIVTVISKVYFKYAVEGLSITLPKNLRADLTNYEGMFLVGTLNAFRLLTIADISYYFKNNNDIRDALTFFSLETTAVAAYLLYLGCVIYQGTNKIVM
jgi:hypothetical protein